MYKMHVIFFIKFFVASCSIHLQLLVASTWELVCQLWFEEGRRLFVFSKNGDD
jgi:hypothetical protein